VSKNIDSLFRGADANFKMRLPGILPQFEHIRQHSYLCAGPEQPRKDAQAAFGRVGTGVVESSMTVTSPTW
jgi:hypothetical protein